MIISRLIKLLPTKPVYAHCDIPCGIYDPFGAQIAAHTVVRMTQLMLEVKKEEGDTGERHYLSQIARITHVKEEHASRVEEELETLLNDYFKPEHFAKFPELKELILQTIKLTGKAKQNLDLAISKELLANVQKVAEIFWQTKGMEPVRIPSGYPTEGEIVSHK